MCPNRLMPAKWADYMRLTAASVADGFGGAATLVGTTVTPDLYGWPNNLPEGLSPAVAEARRSALDFELSADGLTDDERAPLAVTRGPSDIATLVVLGLSRHLSALAHRRGRPRPVVALRRPPFWRKAPSPMHRYRSAANTTPVYWFRATER